MVDYTRTINSGIKRLRLKLGLTQERFAEMAGVSVDTVSNLEQFRYASRPETINSICNSFKISPFELMLPEIEQDEDLLIEIDKKLKLCTNKDLRRINALIDIIRN